MKSKPKQKPKKTIAKPKSKVNAVDEKSLVDSVVDYIGQANEVIGDCIALRHLDQDVLIQDTDQLVIDSRRHFNNLVIEIAKMIQNEKQGRVQEDYQNKIAKYYKNYK